MINLYRRGGGEGGGGEGGEGEGDREITEVLCCAEEHQAVAPWTVSDCWLEWCWHVSSAAWRSSACLNTPRAHSGSNTPWTQWPEFEITNDGEEVKEMRQWQTHVSMTWIWLILLCTTFTWPENDFYWKNKCKDIELMSYCSSMLEQVFTINSIHTSTSGQHTFKIRKGLI